MTAAGPAWAEALAAALGTHDVGALRRLSGGASRETWSFDALSEAGYLLTGCHLG